MLAEVMDLLDAEPSSGAAGGVVPATGSDLPALCGLCEQLAALVSTGKAKEAVGVQLTREQVKCLIDKEVEKYCKRD